MWILKGLLLAVWLVGFATIARIYFEIRRINPHGGAISVSPGWITLHTTRSTVWWIATMVCGAGSFAFTRAWSGPLAFWIAVAVTDLFPIVVLAVYMKLVIVARSAFKAHGPPANL